MTTELTYYEKPVLKEPVWIWTVPMYFYVGGVSGAAMVLGGMARLMGGAVLQPFARTCHWVGFAGGGLGSALLIADLGRPERFLAMLRVLRPRSPMSVGSWILAIAPPCSGAAAVICDAYSSTLAGILGIPLSGYTAVLISNTAVPVWSESRRSLPWLFMASAMASAAQVLRLLPGTRQAHRAAASFGIVGSAAELAAGWVVEQQVDRVHTVSKPLRAGASGALWKASKAMTIAGLALTLAGRSSTAKRVGAILGTAGAIALRYAVFHAGKASARDPRATFQLQREAPAIMAGQWTSLNT